MATMTESANNNEVNPLIDNQVVTGEEIVHTARRIQQNFFDNLGDRDYDEFLETRYLKPVIAYAIAGPPTSEGDLGSLDNPDSQRLFGYSEEIDKQVSLIYESISQLSKYSLGGKKIYMSVLYVCCIPIEEQPEKSSLDIIVDKELKNISVVPVFKIRKCINSGGVRGCCLYVDDIGRLYANWQDYLNNNKLPEKILVVPQGGRYNGTIEDDGSISVRLDVGYSPKCSFGAKLVNYGEKAGIAVALGSLGVLGFSLFTPVAPVIAVSTGVASLVTGIFGATTSSITLKDRVDHSQSIGLQDSEARGCWINIAASISTAAATGSSSLLGRFAKDGAEIGKGVRILHDGILVLSITTGGLGVVNGLTTMILKYQETGQTPNALEVFQFTTSLLFFTHSIVNNRLASTIIEDAQMNQINIFRDELRSNRLRKIYDKTVAETRRIMNDIQSANAEIINSMKQITNKNDFFANLLRSNKEFNQNNIKISLERSGNVLLNGVRLIDPDTIISMSSADRAAFFSEIQRSNVSAKNVPLNMGSNNNMNINIYKNIYSTFTLVEGLIRTTNSVSDADRIVDMFANLASYLSNELVKKLITLVKWMMMNITNDIKQQMEAMGIRGCEVMEFIIDYLRRHYGSYFAGLVEELYDDGELSVSNCKELLNKFTDYFSNVYEPVSKDELKCKVCGGITYSI